MKEKTTLWFASDRTKKEVEKMAGETWVPEKNPRTPVKKKQVYFCISLFAFSPNLYSPYSEARNRERIAFLVRPESIFPKQFIKKNTPKALFPCQNKNATIRAYALVSAYFDRVDVSQTPVSEENNLETKYTKWKRTDFCIVFAIFQRKKKQSRRRPIFS